MVVWQSWWFWSRCHDLHRPREYFAVNSIQLNLIKRNVGTSLVLASLSFCARLNLVYVCMNLQNVRIQFTCFRSVYLLLQTSNVPIWRICFFGGSTLKFVGMQFVFVLPLDWYKLIPGFHNWFERWDSNKRIFEIFHSPNNCCFAFIWYELWLLISNQPTASNKSVHLTGHSNCDTKKKNQDRIKRALLGLVCRLFSANHDTFSFAWFCLFLEMRPLNLTECA